MIAYRFGMAPTTNRNAGKDRNGPVWLTAIQTVSRDLLLGSCIAATHLQPKATSPVIAEKADFPMVTWYCEALEVPLIEA